MFGIKDGFDVVIGNPPYIRVDKIDKNQRKDYKKIYESASGKYDLYYLFFEKALKIINKTGCCTYISPNKFCAADSALKIRNLIFKKINLAEIISLSRIKVFEAAANYPIISLLKQTILRKPLFLVRQVKNLNLPLQKNDCKKYKALPEEFSLFPNSVIPINIDQKTFIFIKQLYSSNFYLSDVLSISEGLRIPNIYESETKHDYEIVKQYQFSKYSKIKLGTFISSSNLRQVIHDSAQRYKRIFMEKIVIAEDALSICATLDLQYRIPQGGVYFGVINNSNIFLKYILALLNSKLLSYIYEKLFSGMHMGGGYLRYRKKFLESLPLSIEAKNADKSEQHKIIEYVDNIYEINKDNCFVGKSIKKMKINKLEKQIDHIVYKLYGLTEEEIKILEGKK
jgi:hypothetical protein